MICLFIPVLTSSVVTRVVNAPNTVFNTLVRTSLLFRSWGNWGEAKAGNPFQRKRERVVWGSWTRPKTEGVLWFQNFAARVQSCSQVHGSTYVFNQREALMKPVPVLMWD